MCRASTLGVRNPYLVNGYSGNNLKGQPRSEYHVDYSLLRGFEKSESDDAEGFATLTETVSQVGASLQLSKDTLFIAEI